MRTDQKCLTEANLFIFMVEMLSISGSILVERFLCGKDINLNTGFAQITASNVHMHD